MQLKILNINNVKKTCMNDIYYWQCIAFCTCSLLYRYVSKYPKYLRRHIKLVCIITTIKRRDVVTYQWLFLVQGLQCQKTKFCMLKLIQGVNKLKTKWREMLLKITFLFNYYQYRIDHIVTLIIVPLYHNVHNV